MAVSHLRYSFYVNIGFSLPSLPDVVVHLQPQPGFSITSKSLFKAYGHISRNTCMSIDEVAQRLAGHTKNPGARCYIQT